MKNFEIEPIGANIKRKNQFTAKGGRLENLEIIQGVYFDFAPEWRKVSL